MRWRARAGGLPSMALPVEESYDLVVVGGGISGLVGGVVLPARAARSRASSSSTTTTISAATPSATSSRSTAAASSATAAASRCNRPKSLYSPVAKGLLRDLGVDIDAVRDRLRARALSVARAVARHVLQPRGVRPRRAGDRRARAAQRRRDHAPAAQCQAAGGVRGGVSDLGGEQGAVVALYEATTRSAGRQDRSTEKRAILKRTSYRDYLIKICGCSEEVANCFQGRTLGFFGLGCDAVPAAEARDLGYPGFAGLKLPGAANAAWSEPYIYHFPDGNASIARLLVRSLVPGVAPGNTMDDVVLAAVRLRAARPARSAGPHPARFDLRRCPRRRRHGAGRPMCAAARSRRVEARHAVLACFHMMIPHIMPELPAPQRAALAQNVKTPIVYTNVLVRNWRAFVNLKVNAITRADGVPPSGRRSISRSASAAIAIRAIRPSRCCCIWCMCRARPTRGSTRAPSSASARASSTR